MKGFGGMDRIGNNLRRVQANQGNPLMPSVDARYATFLPATQHFCPLRNIFARFSDFWSKVTILPQICALFAPNLRLDHSSGPSLLLRQFLPPPINPPSGGALPRFHRSHCVEPHTKVRWRALARRSSQLKPYLPAGAPIPSRWAGAIFPSIFGQAGRVLAALYVPKFTVSELGVKKC